MAPNVRVPANFGVHHLQCPVHCNLTLQLKDGADFKANSMILSYNSPVIDHLTTNLLQTFLEVDDFEAGAVQRFVESLYTGELEQASRDNFRDINKLAHVFEVSWLMDRCVRFFKQQVDVVSGSEYNDILFLVEEARFLMTTLKSPTFLELVKKKMGTIKKERNSFVEQYIMLDFNNASKDQMNVVIELMGSDVHVMVDFLTKHLVVNKECLQDNSRYLLENMNLLTCYRRNKPVYNSLTDALEDIDNISKEDYKMLLKLNKQFTSESASARIQPIQETPVVATSIPNLFTSFEPFRGLSFEELIEELSVSPVVCNLYMFFEAVWLWLNEYDGRLVKFDVSKLREKIRTITRNRGWGKIESCYLDSLESDADTTPFINLIKQTDDLVSAGDWYKLASASSSTTVIKSTFANGGFLKFNFPDGFLDCSKSGCGIILKVTSTTENNCRLYDVTVCTNIEDYLPDMHHHNDLISVDDMHIVIERDSSFSLYPLSWCGKPQLTTPNSVIWEWGFHRFCQKRDSWKQDSWTNPWKHCMYNEKNYNVAATKFVLFLKKSHCTK